jgi:hypothetical protein
MIEVGTDLASSTRPAAVPKRLTEVGLLERRKRGTFADYRLAPAALERVRGLQTQRVRLRA